MNQQLYVWALLGWILAWAPQGRTASGTGRESTLLKLPVLPLPAARAKLPLSQALTAIGADVREGYVLFGIEVRLSDSKEPTVDLDIRPGRSLGDVLRETFRQVPDYTFEVVSAHLVNVYPEGAARDPNELLNLHVTRFDAVDEPPDFIINYPQELIFELKRRMAQRKSGPPLPIEGLSQWSTSHGPRVTLHLRNVSVREILNATSEATEKLPPQYPPLGWVASLRAAPALAAGWAYGWSIHLSEPSNWREQKAKSGREGHE